MKAEELMNRIEKSGYQLKFKRRDRYNIVSCSAPKYIVGYLKLYEDNEAVVSVAEEINFETTPIEEIKQWYHHQIKFVDMMTTTLSQSKGIMSEIDFGMTEDTSQPCLFNRELGSTIAILDTKQTVKILTAFLDNETEPSIFQQPIEENYSIWYDSKRHAIFAGNCYEKVIVVDTPQLARHILNTISDAERTIEK